MSGVYVVRGGDWEENLDLLARGKATQSQACEVAACAFKAYPDVKNKALIAYVVGWPLMATGLIGGVLKGRAWLIGLSAPSLPLLAFGWHQSSCADQLKEKRNTELMADVPIGEAIKKELDGTLSEWKKGIATKIGKLGSQDPQPTHVQQPVEVFFPLLPSQPPNLDQIGWVVVKSMSSPSVVWKKEHDATARQCWKESQENWLKDHPKIAALKEKNWTNDRYGLAPKLTLLLTPSDEIDPITLFKFKPVGQQWEIVTDV
ncbi:MAG: hypothetical protein AB7F31_07360 [Parachlamydiales bacterium]